MRWRVPVDHQPCREPTPPRRFRRHARRRVRAPDPDVANIPQCRQSSHATLRRRTPRAPRQPASRPSRRAGSTAAASCRRPMRQAAIFADAALRRVLEVIDRRRPAAQLRPLLAPSLVDSVLSVGRALVGREPDTKAPRCCAGCGCNPSAGTIRTPRPRFSAPTAAGTGSTPSPAAWNRCPPATAADGWWLPCTSVDASSWPAPSGSGPPANRASTGPTIAMTKTYDVASAATAGIDAPTNPMMIRENSPLAMSAVPARNCPRRATPSRRAANIPVTTLVAR